MGKAIIISGVPGTGKTSIARKLSEELKLEHIDLSSFAKSDPKYILDYDEVRNTYIIDEDKVLSDVEEIIRKSDKIFIVEGHFAHLINPKLVSLVFILYTDPNVLKERYEKRNYHLTKIFENIWAQNLDVIYEEAKRVGHKNIIKVNSTDIDKAYNIIKEEIMKYLEGSN